MNRLFYLLVALIVSFASLVFSHNPVRSIANPSGIIHISSHYLAKKRDLVDVSIGGIKVWMTLPQVTNKLGKPSKISQISDPCTGQKRITLRYYKLVITVLGETVIQIENSNSLYQTGEKIKIGDALSKAKRTYDKILSTPSSLSEDGRELSYDKAADGILLFKAQHGKITSISIMVNVC